MCQLGLSVHFTCPPLRDICATWTPVFTSIFKPLYDFFSRNFDDPTYFNNSYHLLSFPFSSVLYLSVKVTVLLILLLDLLLLYTQRYVFLTLLFLSYHRICRLPSRKVPDGYETTLNFTKSTTSSVNPLKSFSTYILIVYSVVKVRIPCQPTKEFLNLYLNSKLGR